MRTPRFVLASVMLSVIGLVACSSSGPRPFGAPETDAINKLIAEFVTIYNAKDAAKLSRLFLDGGAVMPPNASTVRNTENIREYYVRRFALGASDLVLEPQTISGVGSLAFASGDYRLNMKPPDAQARRDRGKFIFILRFFNERWLLDHLMFSSDFGPEGPASVS
jgi:ketosteroid isomerase-like protein